MSTVAILSWSLLLAQNPAAPIPAVQPLQGEWRAWLDCPGGKLPFWLILRADEHQVWGYILNGDELVEIPELRIEGETVILDFPHYDSRIRARLTRDGTRLDGEWQKQSPGEAKTSMPFHAAWGPLHRFKSSAADRASDKTRTAASVEGRWAVRFSRAADPAVAVFRNVPGGNIVQGTFLTTTGDYRYLEGDWDGQRLRLSCFDGAHAFLFYAQMQADFTLKGDFWSRDSWHETWTARRDPNAELPDAFTQTVWNRKVDLAALKFPDLDGKTRSLADPAFAGKARIIEVFGTWCPNCNDAVRYLVELHGKYKDRGLSIVGLAFEHTGNFERDARQVRRFAKRYDVEYPLLVAGLSDKKQASKAFPLLDRVRSYPTTIFLHADGRVRAIHTGYTGPATGLANYELRAKFESLIEELLAESNRSE